MKKILPLLLLLAAQASADCHPASDQWYDKSRGPLTTRQDRVLLVTHATRGFDSNPSTILGIEAVINTLSPTFETVFIHTGSFKGYMYPECKPEWFYKSAGGAIKLDLEATNTLVLVGGYYSLCQHQTSRGVAKALRNLKVKKDIRLVYVMDATFERLDSVEAPGEDEHVGFTFNYAMMASALAAQHRKSDELVQMLTRVFSSEGLPSEYVVNAHLKNHYWKGDDWIDWNIQKGKGGPKVEVYYLESGDLKSFFGL